MSPFHCDITHLPPAPSQLQNREHILGKTKLAEEMDHG